MARLVVEDSSLGRFLDELPGLIMQYKQMQYMQEERALDREERKADRVQGILLKEYYNKLDEVKTSEAMYDKYSNLSPDDISQGGSDLINIVDKQNNISMDAITSNLNTLSNYQRDLRTGLSEMKDQAAVLNEMALDYAGGNRVLEPHEYQAFQEHALKALDEGGLGWSTTAGADVEYFKTDPEARFVRAYQMTERMKSDQDTSAKGNYAVLHGIFQLGEKEDAGDLVKRLEVKDAKGNVIHTPEEDVIVAIQRLVGTQPNYDEFIANLNALPDEHGGAVIRKELMTNPNLMTTFGNLQRNVKAINALDLELSGINETPAETNLEGFVSSIAGVTNKQALFGLYDQFTSDLDPSQHEPFFNAIEAQLGGEDLGAAYMEFKGFAGGQVGTISPGAELEGSLNLLQETTFPDERQIASELYQRMAPYDSLNYLRPAGQNISPFEPSIEKDPDFYIKDSFEQFLNQIEE